MSGYLIWANEPNVCQCVRCSLLVCLISFYLLRIYLSQRSIRFKHDIVFMSFYSHSQSTFGWWTLIMSVANVCSSVDLISLHRCVCVCVWVWFRISYDYRFKKKKNQKTSIKMNLFVQDKMHWYAAGWTRFPIRLFHRTICRINDAMSENAMNKNNSNIK